MNPVEKWKVRKPTPTESELLDYGMGMQWPMVEVITTEDHERILMQKISRTALVISDLADAICRKDRSIHVLKSALRKLDEDVAFVSQRKIVHDALEEVENLEKGEA